MTLTKENRTTLALGAILFVLGSCGFLTGQLQHSDARQHSDTRWSDLSRRLDRVEAACRLGETR